METRSAGKLGALPRDFSLPALTFEHYLRAPAALPTAPLLVNYMTKVSSWPMYLNDQLGDCTAAGMLHSISAMTAYSGRVSGGAMFTNDTALGLYKATSGYNGTPQTDNGATLASVAQYMVSTGVTDTAGNVHKLVGSANVGDPKNLSLLKQILNTFGTVYCAFDIPDSAMTQFESGAPWSIVPGSSIDGGHCVPLQLSAAGDPEPHRSETFITWGAEQNALQTWVTAYITEAMVLVSSDWLDIAGSTVEGLDLNQLLADMRLVA